MFQIYQKQSIVRILFYMYDKKLKKTTIWRAYLSMIINLAQLPFTKQNNNATMSASLETEAVCVSDVVAHMNNHVATSAVMLTALPSSIVDIIAEFVGGTQPIQLRQRKYFYGPGYDKLVHHEAEFVHVTGVHALQILQARNQFDELLRSCDYEDVDTTHCEWAGRSGIKNHTLAKCFVELLCSTTQPLLACELARKYFRFTLRGSFGAIRTAYASELHRIIEHLRSFNMLSVDDYYSDSERKFRRAMIARVTYRLRHWAIPDGTEPENFVMDVCHRYV
jgi:hypothetical protein